jgi:enoyl-CoA hydratase/carnithine racemase
MEDSAAAIAAALSNHDVGVQLDDVAHVGTIEIRRPPHNYFDGAVIARVVEVIAELDKLGARAVVLCSDGKHFSAGANFSGRGAVAGDTTHDVYELGISLLGQPLPIVAALQGGTIGGGVGLALVCDFRVAAADSWVWINFARLGFHQGFGISLTLPLVVGHQKAQELLLTGRRIDGAEAHRIGLVDRLAPAGRIRDQAFELAAEIAAAGPLATRAIRRTMRTRLVDDVRAAMAAEREIQAQLIETEDFAEGTAAVRDRREPRFTGR